MMKVAIVVFPGSNCDTDCFFALKEVMGCKVSYLWHKEALQEEVDLVILPGGFSYGDYLRPGAIARFSCAMQSVYAHVRQGRYVLGICNGFQILLEAGLLPGAMLRNQSLHFICKPVWILPSNRKSAFTSHLDPQQPLQVPIAHGEGNYYCSPEVLETLLEHDQVAFRYCSESGEVAPAFNPNGSVDNIAGILNTEGNVLGMMPHPERATELLLGSSDGRRIWESVIATLSS